MTTTSKTIKNFIPLTLILVLTITSCTSVDTTEKRSQRLYERLQASNLQRYDITAETINSRVTLIGYVSSEADRQKAEEIALEDPSITQVRNKLKIKEQANGELENNSAFALAKQLVQAVEQDPSIQQFKIETKIVQDKVQLTGQVGDFNDYNRLRQLILNTGKSSNFVNFVTVRERLSDQEIESLVQESLRQANLGQITAQVNAGKLIIAGDLESFEAVDRALTAVVNTPELQSIDNQITVLGKPYPRDRFDLKK